MAALVDRLRAQREASLKPKTKTLPVPGWSGLLHVRYRPMEWEKVLDLLTSGVADAKAALESNSDALIDACDALLVRDDDGELTPLADALRAQGEEVPGDQVRFDEVAVDVLDLKPHEKTARATVLAIFAGAVSPELAIAEHAVSLGAWMRGAEEEVDTSLMGG